MDLPSFLSSYLGLTDAEMQRAAVTGLFQTIGVVITGLAAILTFWMNQRATRRRDRLMHEATIERERELRDEKIEDIQTALLADIKSYPHRIAASDLDRHFQALEEQIRSATPEHPFTPFVPRDVEPQLWTLIAREVHVLPVGVIDPVVSFYTQVETIKLFADDLRSGRFSELSSERKIAMYKDYIDLKRYAALLANDAQLSLSKALDLPAISSREPVPLVPKQASVGGASAASGEAEKGLP